MRNISWFFQSSHFIISRRAVTLCTAPTISLALQESNIEACRQHGQTAGPLACHRRSPRFIEPSTTPNHTPPKPQIRTNIRFNTRVSGAYLGLLGWGVGVVLGSDQMAEVWRALASDHRTTRLRNHCPTH